MMRLATDWSGDNLLWPRFWGDGEGPQAFVPPTSGTASNGLPIYNWSQAAAQLARESSGWGAGAVVTFGFRDTPPAQMPNGVSGFTQFNSQQIALAIESLALWSEVANITFQRVQTNGEYTNNATILFSNYSSGAENASAFAYYPGGSANAGDVWINISLPNNNSNLVEGEFGPHTMAHEIGHAIGLAHPANYDASDAADPSYPASAVYWQDSRMYSVMSYFGSAGPGGNLNAFASGPQLHDIAAAQLLYGANMNTRTGDTVYGFNSNTGHAHFTITADEGSPVFAIWDAGGNDTIDLSGYSTAVEIDLRGGAFSSAGPGSNPDVNLGRAYGNISIAVGVVIENGIGGAGNDRLTGNSASNTLTGGAGADFLDGGAGADRLFGGNGDDEIVYDADDVLVDIQGGAGNDILVFSGSAPTGFNLGTHGFENGERRLIDGGANPWATQTDYFDVLWQLDRTTVINDNSSFSILDYDQANAGSWATVYQAFDTLSRLDVDETTYDNNTRAVLDYDQGNAFAWLTTWASYNNIGLLDTDVVTYDDNSRAVRDFDQSSAFDWQVTWASYLPSGVLDIDVFTYDDGSTAVRDLDQSDAFDWDTAWASYDSLGRLDTDVITYDDGSQAVRDVDQADAFEWAQMWWLYDSNGILVAFQGTNDDGSIFWGG
ncbi:MAG: M57 family metalloprotease [Hyphomonadaceae bacterium]